MARKSARERVIDGMREVGTLLITFAPLDVAISYHDSGATTFLLLFLMLGLLLFSGSVLLEGRRR